MCYSCQIQAMYWICEFVSWLISYDMTSWQSVASKTFSSISPNAIPCRDGCIKIFQKPLDAKKVLKNRSKGIDITSALTTTRNNEVSDIHFGCPNTPLLQHHNALVSRALSLQVL